MHMTITWAGIAAVCGGITALVSVITVAVPWVRRLSEMIDDWSGTPDRPGVPGRDGVMVRLDKIEKSIGINNTRAISEMQRQLDVLIQINDKLEGMKDEGDSESGN